MVTTPLLIFRLVRIVSHSWHIVLNVLYLVLCIACTRIKSHSRNPDTLSITPAHTPISASFIEKSSRVCNFQEIYYEQVDMSLHYGNKPLNTNGLKRMIEFCDFLYTPSVKERHVIVGGHSIWFRSFFQTFLPMDLAHDSKKKKIVNAGIVKFDLLRASANAGTAYMIDQNSIEVVYGGFS
mmetsp:Transcript_10633/g.29329  ORF Transcript_10633/g.29329 Transcript_10633/m.29329 type:complete len:181 (-) Transcript_10633:1341-1883(-)